MTAIQSQKTPGAIPGTTQDSEVYETYCIFDACIRSNAPLPELPVWREGEPGITVKMVKDSQLDLEGFTTCQEWKHDSGPPLCHGARRGAEYLLSFPGLVCFHITPGGTITCLPEPGTADGLVRQLLLSQVLPRYLAHTGALLLHASAVTLPNGKTVAFLGQSGQGKSTLASYCHQHGAQIIDDDCILLRPEGLRISIIGGVPTIRLYPDSLHALDHDPAGFVPYVEYSEKQQMRLPAGYTPGSAPRLLDALYLLAVPGEAPACDEVRIEPPTGQATMMAILSSAFNLDTTDPDTMTRTFSHAAWVLTEGQELGVHLLRYPREYAKLQGVLQALLHHSRE